MNINKEDLLRHSYNCWWSSSPNFPENLPQFNKKEKLLLEKQLDILIKDFDSFFDKKNSDKNNEMIIKELVKNNAKKILSIDKFVYADYFMDNIMETTKEFFRKAHDFDKELKFENITQALRNIWIINVFQFLFEKPVVIDNASFGYSMLYPYTDNVLDSSMNSDEKRRLFDNFGKRLAGDIMQPSSLYEKNLFDLIELLEKDFERLKNPSIYDSFLLIHNAQMESLHQQKNSFTPSYVDNILGISFMKGGSSVLADGFIANTSLSEKEQSIIFSFGVLLQLIDDLQDVEEDLRNGSITIFSQNASKYPLDSLANKLLNFAFIIGEEIKSLPLPKSSHISNLILDNCLHMIFEASSKNKKYFSKKYIDAIELHFKIHFRSLERFKVKCNKKYKKLSRNKEYVRNIFFPGSFSSFL